MKMRYILNWAGCGTTETFHPYSLEIANKTFAILTDPVQNPTTRYVGLYDMRRKKMLKEWVQKGGEA